MANCCIKRDGWKVQKTESQSSGPGVGFWKDGFPWEVIFLVFLWRASCSIPCTFVFCLQFYDCDIICMGHPCVCHGISVSVCRGESVVIIIVIIIIKPLSRTSPLILFYFLFPPSRFGHGCDEAVGTLNLSLLWRELWFRQCPPPPPSIRKRKRTRECFPKIMPLLLRGLEPEWSPPDGG